MHTLTRGLVLLGLVCLARCAGPITPAGDGAADGRSDGALFADAAVDARSLPPDAGAAAPDAPARDAAAAAIACPGLTAGPPGLRSNVPLRIGSDARSYTISAPTSFDPSVRYGLVFVWHGDGGTGDGIRAALHLETPSRPLIYVYPNGVSRPDGWWDLDHPSATNPDIAFFDALLASLTTAYCVDGSRVFSTGFSRGGFFTNHLACQRGDVLRAIAPQSGGGPYAGTYNGDGQLECPSRAVPALVIHGEADTTVDLTPYNPMTGASNGGWQTWRHFAYWNAPAPRSGYTFGRTPADPSPCFAAAGLAADRPVLACFIPGLGHSPWAEQATVVGAFFDRFR